MESSRSRAGFVRPSGRDTSLWLWPPTATDTYCLPPTVYVTGAAPTGAVISGDFQSDAPVAVSTASRKPLPSWALPTPSQPTNVMPLAVFTDLVAGGMGTDAAWRSVAELARKGGDDEAFLRLRDRLEPAPPGAAPEAP